MCPRRLRFAALLLAVGSGVTFAVLAWPTEGAKGSSAAAVSSGAAPAAPRAERPRVRLIATGGTISVRAGGRITADELLRLVPLEAIARAEGEQFANTSSAALTLEQWVELSRRINALFREAPDLAGIVVTTGTDTLEEIGYFLNLTVRDERPVVLVGAMRNASSPDYDGQSNLVDGFRVAAAPDSRGRGVLVVLNGEIHAARDVAKTDAASLDAFRSPDGPLGVVAAGGVRYDRSPARRHTAASEFDITSLRTLPRVDVVLVYQGASGEIISALVDQGARGIVMAAAGAGSLSGTQGQGIGYALRKGAVVVMSTRIPNGRIPLSRAEDELDGLPRGQQPVAAEDLAPLKARILLMLALTQTRDPAAIQQMFLDY